MDFYICRSIDNYALLSQSILENKSLILCSWKFLASFKAELEGVDDAFFQPEASFRPLMHVVAVLADDIRDVNNAQVHREVFDCFLMYSLFFSSLLCVISGRGGGLEFMRLPSNLYTYSYSPSVPSFQHRFVALILCLNS